MLTLPLSTYAGNSQAECARDDIDYYLSKGFTPDQITAICTKPTSDAQPAESFSHEQKPEPALNASQQPTALEKDEQFLKDAIDGRNILLTNDSLQYTLKTCFRYGEEDQYGFAPKACPIVRFVISLNGLEVIRSGKKYIFFGDHEIEVKSRKITREITGGLEEHKPEEQQQIQKHLESGNETIIPIRDDVSPENIKQVLSRLAI